MKRDEAIKIAKSKKSTADQLKSLFGISDDIDLLLARNPNTTAEMLDDISDHHFLDEKICQAVLSHPNISAEQLLNSGWEHPLAMFRNPALPSFMQSRKNFLGEFSGEEFEDSFKKDIPSFVVDWLLSQGKADYQVIYVSSPKRAPEVLERFRESKHSKVVATLLEKDDNSYLAWATDLGFVATSSQQTAPSEIRSSIDAWVNLIVGKNPVALAGKEAVSGLSSSLPNELAIALKLIEDLYFKCGPIAFSESPGFYAEFIRLLQDAIKADATKLVMKVIDFDLGEVKRFGNLGKKALADVSKGSYYAKSGLERSFNRLAAVLANWSGKQSEVKWVALSEALVRLVSVHPLPSIPDTVVKMVPQAKSRNIRQAEIVVQPLEQDEEAYLAWATDLGFTRPVPDADEPASLKSEIDDWVEVLWEQNQALWKELVPAKGSAPTLQGELVRALGRIETEHFKNGMTNWGDGSGFYEDFTNLIHGTLKAEKTFSKLVKKVIAADIGEIKRSGRVGKAIATGKKPREAAFGSSILLQSDVEKSHQRLGALITLWCRRNPDPLPNPAQ